MQDAGSYSIEGHGYTFIAYLVDYGTVALSPQKDK